jgi:glucosylceramidase
VSTSGDANVSVRESIEAQTWDGFGGAFTELGWLYLSRLSDADRGQAIQLLFGSSGARLAWGRVPVGGNDYVVSRHTLDDMGDDVVPDSNESNRPPADLALAKFSIDGDLNNLVPFIKAAQEVKSDIRFWAAAWTPPVWMKTGYSKLDINGAPVPRPSYYDGGSMKGDAATLQAHAQYFVKFVEAYRALGINVEMVAPQNEPAGGHTYPSCAWDASTYTSFIGKYLGPALNAAGLSTRVMLGGSLDSGADTTFVSAVLADSAAKAYCAVAGLGYDMVAASKVTALKSAGIPIWVSEHKAGNYPWNEATYKTIAPNDMAYAVETWGLIRDAINKVGVTAYSTWHMVLDRTGNNIDTASPWAQNALLVADSGHLTATPAYYVFRHLSRFVEPGAKVISTTGGDAVAFKNPNGSVVVVMYNSGTSQAITVALGSRKLHLNVPQGGFATLVDPR